MLIGIKNDQSRLFKHPDIFYDFAWHIVSKIYSKSFLNKELKKKRKRGGQLRSLIGELTNSDYGFVAAVWENNHINAWIDEIRRKTLPEDEQRLYLKKNQVGMDEDDKERYQKVSPKWTSNEGVKREFMEVGWKGEGIAFYNKVTEAVKQAKLNKEEWEELEEGWKEYADKHCDLTHYRRPKKAHTAPLPPLEVPAEQRLPTSFSLPGDDDYEEGLEWQQQQGVGGEDDDGMETPRELPELTQTV